MKAALYCRVSHEDQVKYGISIDAQKVELINYCKENNYDYDFYIDEGISASSMNRQGLKDLLNNISNYSIVLFTKLDRLSRNVLDANIINKRLQQNNVSMKAILEDDVDTSTADGKFMFDLKISLAERELGKTSERISTVFDYKVKVLKTVISGAKIYGYDIVDKKYVVNEKEASNLLAYYNYFNDTGCFRQSVMWWRDNFGYIDYTTARKRLTDKKFKGVFEYKGVEYLDYIPAIIPEELFDKVQKKLKTNKKWRTDNLRTYLFSGIAKCAVCGGSMRASTNNKNNYRYYSCSKHKKNECPNSSTITEKRLEELVLKEIPIIYKTNISAKKYKQTTQKDNTPKIKEKLNKLQELYIEGLIDINNYKEKYNVLNEQLKIEKEKNKPIKQNTKKLDFLGSNSFLKLYNKLNEEQKALFFKESIKEIAIKDKEKINVYLDID